MSCRILFFCVFFSVETRDIKVARYLRYRCVVQCECWMIVGSALTMRCAYNNLDVYNIAT